MLTSSKKLRRWELALLLGLALAALLGVRLDGTQAALADKVLRLHVLANSDSLEDQALKLRVRDAVLAEAEGLLAGAESRAEAEGLLAGAESRAEAEDILAAHLPELAGAGAEAVGAAGYSYPVTASLEERCWFPTKGLWGLRPAGGAVHRPAPGDRGRGGAELVVRGVPAPCALPPPAGPGRRPPPRPGSPSRRPPLSPAAATGTRSGSGPGAGGAVPALAGGVRPPFLTPPGSRR